MGKIYDGIMGLVVGDALGVPFEFKRRDTFTATDMTGYGTYNQPPGTWSDDSSMTLATLESIGRRGAIDPADIMGNFAAWLIHGVFTPYDEVFDVGGATRKAIQRYSRGIAPLHCGGKSVMDNGNGALMRILPVALVPHTGADVKRVGQLTHAHEISQTACRLYCYAVDKYGLIPDMKAAIRDLGRLAVVHYSTDFNRLVRLEDLSRDEIKSTGYVVDTLEAALWCVLKTDSYRDCVLTAVNLGGDTDTVAAVAGGLAGIAYGCGGAQGIPDEWIAQIPRREWIGELCGKLEN